MQNEIHFTVIVGFWNWKYVSWKSVKRFNAKL